MSDDNTGSETQDDKGGAQHDDVMVPKSELTSVIGQRQAEKAKRRAAEQSAAEMAAKLAEYEARDQEREEEEMRKRGEFEKLLEAERKSKADISAQLEKVLWTQRFNNTVAAVSTKAGIDPTLTEGLLLRMQHVSGADVALEEIDDEKVTDLAKALRSAAPSLFQTDGKGGSPRAPGLNMGNKAAGEDLAGGADKARVEAIARGLSTARGG